jgi:hypothetical protein
MELQDLPAMDDLDTLFARLRELPVDSRLGEIDDAVLVAVASRHQARTQMRAMALVVIVSLSVGVLGSIAPAEPVQAATVFPLGAPAALAPSSLLGGGE